MNEQFWLDFVDNLKAMHLTGTIWYVWRAFAVIVLAAEYAELEAINKELDELDAR